MTLLESFFHQIVRKGGGQIRREGWKFSLVTHTLMNCLSSLQLLYNGGEEVEKKTRLAHRDENSAFFPVLPAPLFTFPSLYFFFRVCSVLVLFNPE